MSVIFSFKPVVKKKRFSLSRIKSKEILEKNIIGVCILQEDGTYVIKRNNIIYNVTKKSLQIKGKDRCFVFNKNVPSKLVVKHLRDTDYIIEDFPFMSLAPSYYVKGHIIKDLNGVELFDVIGVRNEIDPEERVNFRNNADKLIDKYNELNRPKENNFNTTEEE